MEQAATLRVRIEADDLDEEEMDRLTRQLWSELRDNADAERIDLVEIDAPHGSKGMGALELGALLVQVLPSAIPGVIAVLKGWGDRRRRPDMKVMVRGADRAVELECPVGTMTNHQLMQLIAVVTNAPAPPPAAGTGRTGETGETGGA